MKTRTFLALTALYSLLIGTSVIFGWIFDIVALKSILSNLVSMKINTAIGFVFIGVVLGLLQLNGLTSLRIFLAQFGAGVVALIGITTIIEYLWGVELGVDELLIPDNTASISTTHPGRMSFLTAVNFSLIGAALFLEARKHLKPGVEFMVNMAATISFTALLGYAFEWDKLKAFGPSTSIALHTSITFLVICLAMMASHRPFNRRFFIIFCFAVSFTITIIMGDISFQNTKYQLALHEWTSHSHQVLEMATRFEASLNEAQTKVRGFVITGDAYYLMDSSDFLTTVYTQYLSLRFLVTENPDQLHRLTQLQPLLLKKLRLLNEIIQLKNQGDPAQIKSYFADYRGEQLMGDIKEILSAINGYEQNQLEQQTLAAQVQSRHMIHAVITGCLIGSVILIGTFILLAQEHSLRHERELELQHLNTQLAGANQELEAFSYSVSHDLRTPLRSLDGFSQLLLTNPSLILNDTGQDYLRRIRAASHRMGNLIDDLLKLSRISRSEIRKTQVNLSALAESVVAHLRVNDPRPNINVAIENDLNYHVDPDLMRIAFDNLFGNAWKFTSKLPSPSIDFGMSSNNGCQVFYIRDNGAGFEMQYAGRLFNAFQRLHGAEEFDGIGIGLATVARIIHRHGGKIWAEAAVNNGATFYFTLSEECNHP